MIFGEISVLAPPGLRMSRSSEASSMFIRDSSTRSLAAAIRIDSECRTPRAT